MVTHFVYDITHFDSKFFSTVKYLVFRPGLLSREYMAGRRSNFLHPVKMYVFTSAVFFLIFFGFFADGAKLDLTNNNELNGSQRVKWIDRIEEDLVKDSAGMQADPVWRSEWETLQRLKDTTKPVTWGDISRLDKDMTHINLTGKAGEYPSFAVYDSVQASLPPGERDGWIRSRLIRKEIGLNREFEANPDAAMDKIRDKVLHRLPYMLFLSLPLFAFILKLLYIRRKEFYYADHGVFTIHLYIFSFILLLIVFGLTTLEDYTGWGVLEAIAGILFIGLNFYLYKAMRVFYRQKRFKTFVKFLLTAFLSVVMMTILLTVFFFFSAFGL